jgi:uncharacterized membrane protein
MSVRSPESRRISSLLRERRVSGAAGGVPVFALLFGLIGFALQVLWVVSVVVLALGLGYVVANARQDRQEVTDRHQEDAEGPNRPKAGATFALPC